MTSDHRCWVDGYSRYKIDIMFRKEWNEDGRENRMFVDNIYLSKCMGTVGGEC